MVPLSYDPHDPRQLNLLDILPTLPANNDAERLLAEEPGAAPILVDALNDQRLKLARCGVLSKRKSVPMMNAQE
jgi:hypothetical protein